MINKKPCTKCKEEKELSDYIKSKSTKDGLGVFCKSCRIEYLREWRLKNPIMTLAKRKKEIAKDLLSKGKKKCYKCGDVKSISMFYRNKEKISGFENQCKACRSDYYIENKEKIKKYYENNKTRLNRLTNKRRMEKYHSDNLFRMNRNLRTRTSTAFRKSRWNKNSSNIQMLGCSFETAHKHIERQFTKGMTWDNQGEWHIDHIIPLSSANSETELKKLCHYTNLQPLWAADNISKGDSYKEEDKISYLESL